MATSDLMAAVSCAAHPLPVARDHRPPPCGAHRPLRLQLLGRKADWDYNNAWKGALKRAGLRGKLFHDLRRVAATELRRAGVPEEVAMQIIGHRTRSTFSRYNLVDLGDVSRAIEQREAYQNQQPVASVRVQ